MSFDNFLWYKFVGSSKFSVSYKLLMISCAELYENLVYYFKYATSAYSPVCPRPNGNSLVMEVDAPMTYVNFLF